MVLAEKECTRPSDAKDHAWGRRLRPRRPPRAPACGRRRPPPRGRRPGPRAPAGTARGPRPPRGARASGLRF
eukprot:1680829-Pyramimonas_sp.AAC.1